MPFPVKGSLIARLLHVLGERRLIAIEVVSVVHEAVEVAVFSGQNYGPTRSADGVRAKTVLEKHALSGELVDVWRWIDRFQPAIVRPNRVGRMVISEHKQDVGSVGRLGHTPEECCRANDAGEK